MNQTEIKELVDKLDNGFTQVYELLKLGKPTKKLRKLIAKSAKRIGKEIKENLKEEAKRLAKNQKSARKKLKPKKKKTILR
jgi:uncharacterized membrane-anchored protein YhcB (DUF1043 family)